MSDLEDPRPEEGSGSLSFSDIELVQQGHHKPQVRDAEHAASFPAVEEIQSMNPPRYSKRTRRLCWLIPLALVVIALAVGIGIGASMNSDESKSEVKSPGDSTVESTPESKFQAIVNWLVKEGISEEYLLQTIGTPQYQAAKWLATLDGASLPLPKTSSSNTQSDGYLYMARYILALVYFQMNGENWLSSLGFLTSKPVCQWNGDNVAIDHQGLTVEPGGLLCSADGIPSYLDLELNSLAGVIPTEVGLLRTLEYFDMEHNDITGMIPTELCNISSLRGLSLKRNKLGGTLPSCLGQLEDLEVVDLHFNELSGSIPKSFCQLTRMRALVLGYNLNLSGKIPPCLGQLTDMFLLHLSDSLYTGQVPVEFSQLSNMEELYLDGNGLDGNPIPTINKMTRLRRLYIEENMFEGEIDQNFAKNLENVQIIDISSNSFTSTGQGIPPHLFQLPELVVLDFSRNNLEGSISTDIPRNDKFSFLSVHDNMMSGKIPSQLSNLERLLHLDLSNNAFDGPLPEELFTMANLTSIFLSRNPDLDVGQIPNALAGMKQLREITLRATGRIGPLPELLGFEDLILLDLGDNSFHGNIPANYGNLGSLRYLLLDQNRNVGGVVPNFAGAKQLQSLSLDKTGVTGNMSSICDLPAFFGKTKNVEGDVFAVADCKEQKSGITCGCCHCCSKDQPVCSEPAVESVDYTWEYLNAQAARNFLLNESLMAEPVD